MLQKFNLLLIWLGFMINAHCDCGSPDETLQFVDCGHPILDSVCAEFPLEKIKEPKVQQLFDTMLSFARGEQSDKQRSILVGLAAPQIGMNMRVILVDVKADGKGHVADLRVYINPEILEYSEEKEIWYEGCFSTGDIRGVVKRPSQVTIKAFDREGNILYETHTGYVARIFQHEIDHLNGIRFPERVSDPEMLHLVTPEEMCSYRNQEKWREWKKNILPEENWRNYLGIPLHIPK